jgi:hypothetical protein
MDNMVVVECPKCGNKQEFYPLSTIHSKVDAYEAQQMKAGNLFRTTCEKCGKEIELLFELVYFDDDHDAMIYFVREENVSGVYTALDLMDHLFAKDIAYNDGESRNPIVNADMKRIVTNPNALVEKALIFENDMDDRVIELIKLVCISKLAEKDPDFDVIDAYFDIYEGREVIVLYSEDAQTTALIPDGLYDSLVEDYGEAILYNDSYIIDEDWALEIFEEYN